MSTARADSVVVVPVTAAGDAVGAVVKTGLPTVAVTWITACAERPRADASTVTSPVVAAAVNRPVASTEPSPPVTAQVTGVVTGRPNWSRTEAASGSVSSGWTEPLVGVTEMSVGMAATVTGTVAVTVASPSPIVTANV